MTCFLLVACGSVPVPVKIGLKTEQVIASDRQGTGVGEIGSQADQPPKPHYRSATGYWKYAIERLQVGEASSARWALQEALRLNPNSKIALKLQYQIDADPIEVFGAESFEYRIIEGDSLSKIAKKFLDDALMFHLLAKYNHIDNPHRLVIGQRINVPESYSSVVDVDIVPNDKTMGIDTDSQPLVVSTEKSQVYEPIESAQVFAITDVDDIIHSEMADTAKINELVDSEERYAQGLKALNRNDYDTAYRYFTETLTVNSNHEQARKRRDELRPMLVSKIYKKAFIAQKRQQLDKAIALWDKILLIKPNHENARLHRVKALELREYLKKFLDSQNMP